MEIIITITMIVNLHHLEASHPAVLGRHVVPQVVLGEIHSKSLVSLPSLVLVAMGVALLVQVVVFSRLRSQIFITFELLC